MKVDCNQQHLLLRGTNIKKRLVLIEMQCQNHERM